MNKMKDEDLSVRELPSPAFEAPTTSLLNDLKYSLSGECWASLYCSSQLFRVGITLSQGSMWNAQLRRCFSVLS